MEIAPTPIIEIHDTLLTEKQVKLYVKRDDLIHSLVSGNKWRKLKYNLITAKKQGFNTLLTFGGAFSNHIYAVAAAGKLFGFKSIGIIRGEEHVPLNPTLAFAQEQGMHLHYLDRQAYRNKTDPTLLSNLRTEFGDHYLIPEGGSNELAIKGCEEIITEIDIPFDIICSPVGTGGTLAGLIAGLRGQKRALGFSALKGDFLNEEVASLLESSSLSFSNWEIINEYHFGGYAKLQPKLIELILEFEKQHNIPLEPIYTGKMLYGLFNMIRTDHFNPGTKIVTLHTGGLQGNAGFDFRKSF